MMTSYRYQVRWLGRVLSEHRSRDIAEAAAGLARWRGFIGAYVGRITH